MVVMTVPFFCFLDILGLHIVPAHFVGQARSAKPSVCFLLFCYDIAELRYHLRYLYGLAVSFREHTANIPQDIYVTTSLFIACCRILAVFAVFAVFILNP